MDFELERRRMMMAQKAAEPVSYGWIRNETEGAYIDTGIIPNQDTRVVIRARGIVPGGGFMFGARNSYRSNTFTLLADVEQLTGAFRLDYNTQQVGSAFIPGMFFFEHEYDMNRNKLYIDGVQVASTTAATFSPNINLYLFGVNNNGSLSSSYHPFEISTARIYQNDVLVRDYIATPDPGFYDRVSGTLFTNAGTGNLAYFSEHPHDALCTQLEYVISQSSPTGIDSGVYATRDLFVTSIFYLNPDTLAWQSYLGIRPASGYDFDLSFGTNTVANTRAYHRVNGGSSTASPNITTSNYLSSKIFCWQKNKSGNSRFWQFNNTSVYGSATQTVSASYRSKDTLCIGAVKKVGESISDLPDGSILGFFGRIYSCALGFERCYAPVLYGSKAGLYDLLTDTFHPSETMHDFVAGPLI